MTEEEKTLFIDWKNNNKDKIESVVITLLDYEKGVDTKTCYDEIDWLIRKAFLAGLKEGKPKWHKVADGDLPEENHFVLVLNKQTGYEIARHAPFEEYHLDNWVTVDNRSLVPIKNNPSVIAWCEIPKYTEE